MDGVTSDSDSEERARSINWKALAFPLILIVGGGVLIDLLPIGGASWLIVCLIGALLAGRMAGNRSAFLVPVLASIIVLVGTALIDGDGDSAIGGRFPIIETLLVVTLPMLVFTWMGIRLSNRSTAHAASASK